MSAIEEFVENLSFLEKKWDELRKSKNQDEKIFEASDFAEFNELIKLTLNAYLDFRISIFSCPKIDELRDRIKIIISSFNLKDNLNQSIDIALNTQKWDSNFGLSLLSGKLVGSGSSKLTTFEKRLLYEDDDVIRERLDSCLHLIQHANLDDDTGQMILNVYETYRKMLLRDVKFQCKLSSGTIEKLFKNYLLILCHRKQQEHLVIAIKLFPTHRKIKYIFDVSAKQNLDDTCELHIAEGFVEDLLCKEFRKELSMQNIKNYNLYICQLINLAAQHRLDDLILERIMLSENDRKVMNDYYYLVATQLRLLMPNSYNELVLKLISIGLSRDISFLEQLKYGSSEGYADRDEASRQTYRRMFLALVTLGCIIQNYSLRRLCFEAAKVCEYETNYCIQILRYLPVNEDVSDENNLESVLLDIRYQLETFQYDIKDKTQLPNTFAKCSNIAYETLEHFNHRIQLSEDLKPLEYPGVEKYLKKQAIEETEHISQTSDLDKCLTEIDEFNLDLSSRLKKLGNPLPPIRELKLPSNEDILKRIKEILSESAHFKVTRNGDIIAELVSINFTDLIYPNLHWDALRTIQSEQNEDNLFFDFDTNEETNDDDDIDIDSLYQKGTIPVRNLFSNGFVTYEIENIMLYGIMEKKMKFISEEFSYLNKNRNCEVNEEQNQVYAGLLYLASKPHPEYARLMRLTMTMMRYSNVMDYLLDTYLVDVTPGKYKYKQKNKVVRIKTESGDDAINTDQDTSNNSNKDNSLMDTSNSFLSQIKVEEPSNDVVEMAVQKKPNVKKEKIAPAISLNGVQTFNTSSEIQSIFQILKREMTAMIDQDVMFDLSKITDVSSSNLIQSTMSIKSLFTLKLQKVRNSHPDPRETLHEIQLPLNVSGKINIFNEFRDEIEYDQFYDNPRIKSSSVYRIAGTVTIENLTHSAKVDIDCVINNLVSRLRFIFQGTKTYKPRPRKKPVQMNPPINQTPLNDVETSIKTEMPVQVSVIQSISNALTMQSTSNNNDKITTTSNIVMNVNTNNSNPSIIVQSPSNSHSNVYPSTQQSYLPPFGSITSSTPNYTHQFPTSVQQQQPQYSHSHSISMADEMQNISSPPVYSSVIQVPVTTSSNNNNNINGGGITFHQHADHQYNIIKKENSVVENILSSPNRAKPKVEILKIENVNVSPKLSFGNPLIMVKEEVSNGFTKSNETNNASMIEELVDFEDEIGQSAIIPKKPCNVLEQQDSKINFLPVSPPPLHYPVSIKEEKPIILHEDLSRKDPIRIITPKKDPIMILGNEKVSTPVKKDSFSLPKCELPLGLVSKHLQKHDEEINKIKFIKNPLTTSLSPHQSCTSIMKTNNSSEINGKRINIKDNDVIDLTEDVCESIDLTSFDHLSVRRPSKKIRTNEGNVLDIHFISCDSLSTDRIPPSEINANIRDEVLNVANQRSLIKKEILKKKKRPLSPQSSAKNMKQCKVLLIDVMKGLEQKDNLKKDMKIRLTPFMTQQVAEVVPCEEPIESYTDDVYDTTFTIVCQNSVSYLFNDDVFGDGIAKIMNSHTNRKCNNANIANFGNNTKIINTKNINNSNYVNKFNSQVSIESNLKDLKNNLLKTSYSDKNLLNFTKNLKNRKKFHEWSPKVSNCNNNNSTNDKKLEKSFFGDEKNHKSLLYQISHAVINSIPGMNSFEFFKMPATPRRALQIEVVHLKDIKNNASSNESSDVNDCTSSEPGNSHNDTNNGDSISNATTIHIQKIGQTSISHETESRTLQTSFGSIIKNTYPPATSRIITASDKEKLIKLKSDDGSMKKISIGETSLKSNHNVKIIACTSSQQQQNNNDASKSMNKNQTLINMLTQQVMVPTNSNRHYIITSATKQSDIKVENSTGTSCTLTSSSQNSSNVSNSVRKTIANTVGQSQLVQILNSPPSNFTMKALNVITSTASVTKSNQVITTVSSSPSLSTVDGLKAELPNSVKQQGIVQFICKTDGKIIHLTPICNSNTGGVSKKITYKVDTSGAKGPTILHHANQQIILNNQLRREENPNILTIIQKQGDTNEKKINVKNTIVGISTSQNNPSSPINTRSMYEETYAKFIQSPVGNSSNNNPSDMGLLTISSSPVHSGTSSTNTFIQKIGKTVIQSSNQVLPKFNQAFGKSIFSSASVNEQIKNKITANRETITRSIVSSISPVTKITAKNEMKANDGTLLNLIENESAEKSNALPTFQSTLQPGNNLLYARPIGNGKLIASNNNNVLLTALRSNSNATNNVRIITSLPESMTNSNHRTIMTPVRISVPIQIPQLINSVKPQSPGNFRQQIVIATTPPSSTNAQNISSSSSSTIVRPQGNIQCLNQSGSKLQSLLMAAQSSSSSQSSQSNIVTTINHHEVENETIKIKDEQKQKKSVDNSTLEQLREFDMVLEQVLERSSVTPNSVSSPPRPDSANRSSPRKQISESSKNMRNEPKSSSVSLTSNSPNDSPTSSKSLSANNSAKTTPKLQEDEHTAQRILDILANYKEQVRNSPDLNNKPAPRRRANPPSNPPAKRKKISSASGSMKNSKQFGSSSDVMTDTMGSEEDSSCGVGSGVASTGSINNSPRGDIDDHTDVSMDNNFYMEDAKRENALSPQSSSSSITTSPAHNKFSLNRRLLVSETKNINTSNNNNSGVDSNSSKSLIISSSQSSASSASSTTRTSIGESIERLSSQGSTAAATTTTTTAAVLMPGNYLLPMNVLKSGQHLAILSSNNGQKIIALPASQLTQSSSAATSGTSIILQRYVNQLNEGGNNIGVTSIGDKTILTKTINESDDNKKTLRLQHGSNMSIISSNHNHHKSTLYVKPIESIKQEINSDHVDAHDASSSSNSFVSDKTLITEIIQQQQQLSHNHPQHNFMIKLNENSDPRSSSSSIMFMGDTLDDKNRDVKIKTEKMVYDDECLKEEVMDLNNEHELLNSPMLIAKMEVDENTSSNHDVSDADNSSQKLPQFPSILNSCLSSKQINMSGCNINRNTRGFLIDPSSKILMYNDRKQNNIVDKEIFNPKSFTEECADLGVDEPIASDLFPEADLLFDSGSPKFDQISSHDGAIQIKRELENGEVLLQMNYNHNITEPWLNFDTEDELVDGESGDDAKDSKINHF